MTTLRQKKVTLLPEGDTCTITPNARRTVASLATDGNITMVCNVSKSHVGDELVLVVTGTSFTLTFGEGMIFTSCGEVDTDPFSRSNNWIGHFFFDGEKFLNTVEDC